MRLLAAALRPLGRLVVAERFKAPAGLAAISIPPPPLDATRPVRVIVLDPQSNLMHSSILKSARPADLALAFHPFPNPDPSSFVLLLFQPAKPARMWGWQKRLAALATASRPPITLTCTREAGDAAVRGTVLASWREDGGCQSNITLTGIA